MTDLADFLLTRVAEDEAVALESQQATRDEARRAGQPDPDLGALQSDLELDSEHGFVGIDASRILAECEAKRRIVQLMVNEVKDARRRPAWTMPDEKIDEKGRAYRMGAENQKAKELPDALDRTDRLLRFLALPYADHPEWREEWKP